MLRPNCDRHRIAYLIRFIAETELTNLSRPVCNPFGAVFYPITSDACFVLLPHPLRTILFNEDGDVTHPSLRLDLAIRTELRVLQPTIVENYPLFPEMQLFADVVCIYLKPWLWTTGCCSAVRMDNLDDISQLPVIENCDIGNILLTRIPVFKDNGVAVLVCNRLIDADAAGAPICLVLTRPTELDWLLFGYPLLKEQFCMFMIIAFSGRRIVVRTFRCRDKVSKVGRPYLSLSEDDTLVAICAFVTSPFRRILREHIVLGFGIESSV